MNTKKLFMLLAAVLLGSVSAFSQSSETPQKGDVNEDGIVDVADITAVIKIMKDDGGMTSVYTWYYGVTEEETFTTSMLNMLGTKPKELPSIGPAIGDDCIVWMYPSSWGKPTSMKVNGDDSNPWIYSDVSGGSWMTVPNGYIAAYIQSSGPVTITEIVWPGNYYWYVGRDGTLLGENENETSYNLDLSNLSTVSSISDIYTESKRVGSGINDIYVVCPTEWVGQFKITDLDNNEVILTNKTSQITSGVTGYSLLRGVVSDPLIKVVR